MTNDLQRVRKRISVRTAGAALVLALILVPPAHAQTFKVLYAFSGPDGPNPQGNLLLFAGNLYGTTRFGGSSGNGTVVQLNIKSLSETVLYSFGGGASDGANPLAGLVADSSGSLYGTTVLGGASNQGTLFQVNPLTTITLHSFSGGPDGGAPQDSLVADSKGYLYGTTYTGGTPGGGTAFKVDTSGNVTTLHTFLGGPNQGSDPVAGLLLLNGYLYGTNINGPCASCGGTVFRVNAATGKASVLYTFTYGADGGNPQGQLITDGQGNLYGTTLGGGASPHYYGVVFKLNIATHQYTVLHAFTGGDGSGPIGGLLRDPQGNLYGTTINGGASGIGTAYKLDTSGTLTVLHSFLGPEGGYPYAGLVRDSSGNLYGAAYSAGSNGSNGGTIFEITP